MQYVLRVLFGLHGECEENMTAAAYSCQLPSLSQEEYDAFVEKYWKEHIEPGSETAPESRGAHAAYLSRILAANRSGYFVGEGLTIAGR